MKYFVIGGTTALNKLCGVCGIIHRDVTGVAAMVLTKSKASLGYLDIKKKSETG